MRPAPLRLLVVAALCLGGAACTRPSPPPADPTPTDEPAPMADNATVLDAGLADAAVQQCSRESPETEGSWTPTPRDVANLEANLPALREMESDVCCGGRTARVEDPDAFYRQYVGVVVGGRRLIYVNAFARNTFEHWPEADRPDWRREPQTVCDGGESFWGVLYDPERRTFSHLAFNGSA